MATRERTWDIDALLWLMRQPGNEDKRYELIEGELFEVSPVNEEHGFLAGEIYRHIRNFDPNRDLGIPSVETGHYRLGERRTLLAPDVAFRRWDSRARTPYKSFVPRFPDLAVEVVSPSDSMAQLRRKATILLERGTQLVWIVKPDEQEVEVRRLDADGDIAFETVGIDGSLSGEGVLPGFTLSLRTLFR